MIEWTNLATDASDASDAVELMTRVVVDFSVLSPEEAPDILRRIATEIEGGARYMILRNTVDMDFGRAQVTV